jgi:hypothetical protein
MTRAAAPLIAAAFLASCYVDVTVREPAGEPLPIARGKFPHEALGRVLEKYVDAQGRVDYKGLRADRAELERYLIAVAATSPHQEPDAFPSERDKLAYWINAYNAYVLYAVTERPLMKAINEDLKTFFYFTQYEFGKERWSLYRVENLIVRKEFAEPRVHFALNCGSVGCPQLPIAAFQPERLEDQLARESRKFCDDDRRIRMKDPSTVEVSQLFEFYSEDFRPLGGALAFCRMWGRGDLPSIAEVRYIPWDWTVNAQPSN